MNNQEHEARRYRQIASLERDLNLVNVNVASAKSHVKELEKEADGILMKLRAAARDEGELPLIDMMEEVGASAPKAH